MDLRRVSSKLIDTNGIGKFDHFWWQSCPFFWQFQKAHPYYYLQSLWRVSGAIQFISVVVDIRVVVEISSGHHWWTSFRATQATCNHFLHAGVNVAMITQCTFDFIFHCCHCNHCNDCALQWLCILHIVLVYIYTMYYTAHLCKRLMWSQSFSTTSRKAKQGLGFFEKLTLGCSRFCRFAPEFEISKFFFTKKAEKNRF